MQRLLVVAFLSIGISLTERLALAELPALEAVAAKIPEELVQKLRETTVVVSVRSVGKSKWPWPVHEALASEITAVLRLREIDAINAACDYRIDSLSESRVDYKSADAKRVKPVNRTRLLSGGISVTPPEKLSLVIWDTDSGETLGTYDIDVPPAALQLEANLPELNRKVVAFCRKNVDKPVANGICAELAGEALVAAGARRSGVYTWGRELCDNEPILPGDILQMELVEMKSAKFSRNYHHHTAVVEDVTADSLIVLQQNVPPKGKVVQRDTWPLAAINKGYFIAFRPWMGGSPLPSLSPRRRTPATIVKKGKTIDLMHTLNPRLDSVKGIWFMEEGTLRPNRDSWARLQVPFSPPESYTLNLKVKRLVGEDQFGVGLLVGKRQVLMSLDAYAGTTSGLHLVEGKSVKKNSTTYTGPVLPVDKLVPIRIKVTPESVVCEADGKTIVHWKGLASQLSQDTNYAVPNTEWLFLASWNSHFAISEYSLEDDTAVKK